MKINTRCLALGILALALYHGADAQEAGQSPFGGISGLTNSTGYVDLLAGVAYTDNALLSHTGTNRDGIGTAGVDIDYAREGRLSLNMLGNVERVEYFHHSFGGSFDGQFNGSALWGRTTDPLQWLLRDSFGEGMTNPLAAATPSNLQTVNSVSTGPFLNLNFGLTNRFTLFGLYSRTTFQRSPYDSQMYEGGAQLAHRLSGASTLSLQASDARTDYLDKAALIGFPGNGSQYEVRQASIDFNGRYVRTHLLLRAGYNTINYGGPRHGSPLYEARLSRNISPFSTVFVAGQMSYSTLGGAMQSPANLLSLQGTGIGGFGLVTPEPFKQRDLTAGWNFERDRTSMVLNGSYQQVLYEQRVIDNHRVETVNLTLARQLQPTLSVQLRVASDYVRYTQVDAHTQRQTVTLSLAKQFARSVFWIYARRVKQTGTSGTSGFAAADYHDDQVGIEFTYDLIGQRMLGAAGPGLSGMRAMPGVARGY